MKKLQGGGYVFDERIIISGNIIEYYKYEKTICKGRDNGGGRHQDAPGKKKAKNRADTLSRAKKTVRRTINANVGAYGREFISKFVTLTFREHVTEFEIANYEFTKFMQRLNYSVFGVKKSNLKYTVVPEFTKKGRIHFHVIFYNLPYLKADHVSEVWGQGFIKINKIDHVDNVGAYICKYMTKDNDDERLHAKKSYFNSRGLFEPVEITQKKEIDKVVESLPASKIKFLSDFENEYLGKISYVQYNISDL